MSYLKFKREYAVRNAMRGSTLFLGVLLCGITVARVSAQATVDLNFDDRTAPYNITTEYNNQGFQPFSFSTPGHTSPQPGDVASLTSTGALASAACQSAPWSLPNYIHSANDTTAGLGWRFTSNQVTSSVAFSLLQAGNATVQVTFYDAAGSVLRQTLYGAPGNGRCSTRRITINHANIVRVEMRKTTSGSTDGYGVDNITYSPLASPQPPSPPTITSLDTACPSDPPPTTTLRWTAVSDATSYLVYRDGVLIGSTGATTYMDAEPALQPLQRVTYTIYSKNSVGVSPPSPGRSITTDDCFNVTIAGPGSVSRGADARFEGRINGTFYSAP